MVSGERIVTAVGGRAPDFVPAWVELLLFVLALGLAGMAMHRRNKR
ncbi:hypothetical protein ACH4NF_31885 [Streptomyces sp. NPDC017248]